MRLSRPLLGLAVAAALVGGVTVAIVDGGPGMTSAATPSAAPTVTVAPDRPASALTPIDPRAPRPTAAGLQRALAGALADPGLGTTPSVAVVDAETGEQLLGVREDRSVIPASTAKLATAVAALTVLPPTMRLHTRVVRGATAGELVLVGGGDPTLAGPTSPVDYPDGGSLTELAEQVAAAGVTTVDRLLVDTSLYAGPELGPGWRDSYVTGGDVAPVVALMTDDGRLDAAHDDRTQTPALLAGRQLLDLLRARGVNVSPDAAVDVSQGQAPAGADQLAVTDSAPMPVYVEQMLRRSDNDMAEALARQVALKLGEVPSFAGAAAAVRSVITKVGVPAGSTALVDASGLSRDDRLQPSAVTKLLALAASDNHPELRPLLAGLPVAGFAGTLFDRFRSGASAVAAGQVRAKTGTLDGVSALAGVVVDADGRLLIFDLTADGVPPTGTGTLEARQSLDDLAGTLAGCGCR